ncbi:GntR family transcriptional regulator [Leucobacter sp. wl10]|uniref:GntR family transcriptional regulator n=1 Tax=Leucobacter sp. wl10 TaxID=2304677 RepID=UPI000E5BF8A9|nr:GntR family transcriptional regulator [Leucobacter sp. wl10]RGE24423.1 GntR family transcriptional regulator [Leucobacter sp. wl10]
MALERIDATPRVGDRAFDVLHSAIMSGRFPPGQRLQPGELSAQLGISTMPIREAVKRLKALGLVEDLPHRGTVVKVLSGEELLHIYQVRAVLEIEATRLGAPHMTEEALLDAEVAYAQMARALQRQDVVEYTDRDEEILALVYEASGNPVLLETIRHLWSRCRSFKIVGVRQQIESGEREPLLVHQRRLIEAIRRGDAAEAGRITAESLDAAIERITSAIDEG